MRILAVDDEPLFLEILEVALNELGHDDITPAFSAQAALRELEHAREDFDCILLDIRMPGMDGVQLCQKIRAMPQYRRTPIMMVTVMSDRGHIDAAFAAGATDYLNKPLDMIELKARMAVMGRLVQEQRRAAMFEHRAIAADDLVELKFDLDTPVPVQGYDRLVEYLALQNYLLRLSLKESYSVSVFAISISNAGRIFNAASPVVFMNLLGDVAACIESALKSVDALISYAGNGNFVVVPTGGAQVDTAMIEDVITLGLEEFSAIYLSDRIPMPRITVGTEVRRTLFSRPSAESMLSRAIQAASKRFEAEPKTRRKSA